MKLRTASELARIICQCENDGRSDSVRFLTRRIRHFENEDWIVAAKEKRDDRGTSQYDVVQGCMARLLSILNDFGFDKAMLSQAHNAMSPKAHGVLKTKAGELLHWENNCTVPPLNHIEHLPSAIIKGEEWLLKIKLNAQGGNKIVSGGFTAASIPDLTEEEQKEVELFRDYHNVKLVGKAEFPASDLCKKLVEDWER